MLFRYFASSRFMSLPLLGLLVVFSSTTRGQEVKGPAPTAAKPPNVVLILADDFGYGSTNASGAPESLVKTPHLNRIASEGKRFVNAYTASSVCSPTRYALLTGRYSFRTSLARGVLNTFAPLHIGTDQLNVASLLKKQGYNSAAIGKWHLGYGQGRSADARTDYKAKLAPGPLEIGFDYHFGVPSNHGDLTGVFVENHYVYGLRNGKVDEGDSVAGPAFDDTDYQTTYDAAQTEAKRLSGIEIDAPRRKNSRVMSVLTDKTVAWIEKQSADKPFFLYYTPVAVHNPVTPDDSLKGTSAAGVYGDWIHELDRSVGAVLAALDKKGFSENTLVIFTSDNGGVVRPNNKELVQTVAREAGLKVNGDLRGGKHTIFEGGFRVPYFVRWPGKVKAGSTSQEVISLADTLATVAALVGEPIADGRKAAQDNYNILPAFLEDAPNKNLRRDVVVHSADGVFAIRKGDWKWIEGVPVAGQNADSQNRADNFEPQLYNLESDPFESKNVLAEHPEIAAELKTLLDRYRQAGFSRELPTDQDLQSSPVATAGNDGKIPELRSPIDKLPSAPWNILRGKWTTNQGALEVTVGNGQPAALTVPFTKSELEVQYSVRVGDTQRQTVRIDLGERQAFRFDVSKVEVGITKNDSDGAGLINVVTGGDAEELAADGVFLDHDQRYEQTDEFLRVWKDLAQGRTVDFSGKHVRIAGARQYFPTHQPSIPLYFGGSSPAALQVAAEHVDMYLTWGEPPAQVADKIAAVRALAAQYGRSVRFGIRLHVIVRDTVEEARRAADKLIEYVTPELTTAAHAALAKYQSDGQRRMLELHRHGREGLWLRDDLWAGVGLVRGGAGTAMVGDGATVSGLMQEYASLGIDTFVLSGYPHLEEAYHFAEHVFPHLNHVDNSPGRVRSEVIANGSIRVPGGANGSS